MKLSRYLGAPGRTRIGTDKAQFMQDNRLVRWGGSIFREEFGYPTLI